MDVKPLDLQKASIEEIKEAFMNGYPIVGLKALLTHKSEHQDEVIASVIFKTYGQKRFPECKNIGIGFVTNKEVEQANHGFGIFWNMLKHGYLCLGFGGGPLDDHDLGKEKECCATLMAKLLKVRGNPELNYLLEHTLFSDKNGDKFDVHDQKDKSAFAIAARLLPANMIKAFWERIDHDHEKTREIQTFMDVMINFYSEFIESQRVFHEKRANADVNPETILLNDKERVTFVQSDVRGADKIARFKTKKNHRKNILTVIVNEKDQIVSLNNPNDKINIEGYVRVLRSRACDARGLPYTWKELGEEGEMKQVPELLYIKEHQNLYNGSHSHPDVEGLFGKLIKKEDFLDAVNYGLGKNFHKDYHSKCSNGVCAKSCPLFKIGLRQCSELREAGSLV